MQTSLSPGGDAEAGGCSGLLKVDEAARPRALSQPDVSILPPATMLLPEITVEDCTDPELCDIADGKCASQGQGRGRGLDPSGLARPRANSCPEDLFQKPRGERPPTPPPGTYRKGRRFHSGFSKPVVKETVSFAHHRLSKLTESEDAEDCDSDSDGDGGGVGDGEGGCSGGASDPDSASGGASAAAGGDTAATAAISGIEGLRLSSHSSNSWPSRCRRSEMPTKCGSGSGPGRRADDKNAFLSGSDSSLLPAADKDSLAAGGSGSGSGGGGGGSGSGGSGCGDGGGSSLLAMKATRRPGSTEARSADSRFAMTGNQRSVVPATRLTIF